MGDPTHSSRSPHESDTYPDKDGSLWGDERAHRPAESDIEPAQERTPTQPEQASEQGGRSEVQNISADPSTVWDRVAADFYRAFPPLPSKLTYGPLVATEDELKLLGTTAKKRILDLGCGAGFGSVALAKAGAHVIAVDFSARRLDIARRLAEKEEAKVEFRQAGLSELIFIPADSLDIVVSAWSLNFTPEWPRVFRAVSRVLAPGGIFVLSIEHPFWTCLNPATGSVLRPYKDGQTALRELIPGNPSSASNFYSYTIGGIVSSLMKEGFSVLQVLELHAVAPPTDPWYKAYLPSLAKNLPPVLVVKCEA